MKIMLVNTVDSISGAARACYRLHVGLISIGLKSMFLAKIKLSKDDAVLLAGLPFGKLIDRLFDYYVRFKKKKYTVKNNVSYSLAIHPDRLLAHLGKHNPDIIHLHWFNKGFIKLETLQKIDKPVVWTLHDMWAFTGGCHYTQECTRYLQHCGACPVLNSDRANDLSAEIFRRKESVYKNIPNLHIVTPSRWLGQCASESSLLKDIPVHIIPNGIDVELFKPLNRNEVRKKWNIPQDKLLILFGALKPTGDPRKGFKELSAALHLLSKNNDVELLVFGASESKDLSEFGFKINFVGKISNDRSLAELYSAADVMVVPSLQENLSNTIVESLSCGLPVVAFDIGGNADMIDHQKCGYLAKPFDNKDLANGIDWVICETDRREILSKNAREKAVSTYDHTLVAQKHLALYEKIM